MNFSTIGDYVAMRKKSSQRLFRVLYEVLWDLMPDIESFYYQELCGNGRTHASMNFVQLRELALEIMTKFKNAI